jgi:hypothetical protein
MCKNYMYMSPILRIWGDIYISTIPLETNGTFMAIWTYKQEGYG